MITEFIITAGEKRKRLDTFLLHREPEISRSSLQRLIELGRIQVNAQTVKPSKKIKPGDHVTMDVPQPGIVEIKGAQHPLDILHEDEILLVINKPAGIVVHPTSGNWSGTLLNGLLAHFQETSQTQDLPHEKVRPGLVHRLDKHTSGVMVIAKNHSTHRALSDQFEQHTITRTYEALTWGIPKHHDGIVNLAIGRDIQEPKKHSTHTTQLRRATTEYHVIHRYGTLASHIILHPLTGRTHQLRVHLTSLDTPILGDTLYGGEKVCQIEEITIPRIMLHARVLGFQHPASRMYQEYIAECPTDMQIVRNQLLNKVEPRRF